MPARSCGWPSSRAAMVLPVRAVRWPRPWETAGVVAAAVKRSTCSRTERSARIARRNIVRRGAWSAASSTPCRNGQLGRWRRRTCNSGPSRLCVLTFDDRTLTSYSRFQTCSRINPFYAAHQLFRLAGFRPLRYSFLSQVSMLKSPFQPPGFLEVELHKSWHPERRRANHVHVH
jgi:hypothetical protein